MNTKRKDRSTIKDAANTFFTTQEERKKLELKASKMGISKSDLCRLVLNEYLKKEGM